jgi:hypothetical protein
VQAMFPKSAESKLSTMTKGQSVLVRCQNSGKLGNVILRGCELP